MHRHKKKQKNKPISLNERPYAASRDVLSGKNYEIVFVASKNVTKVTVSKSVSFCLVGNHEDTYARIIEACIRKKEPEWLIISDIMQMWSFLSREVGGNVE